MFQQLPDPDKEKPADMISGPRGELARFPDRTFHLSPSFTLEDSDPTAAASTTDIRFISWLIYIAYRVIA